jgi:hypothetical protein
LINKELLVIGTQLIVSYYLCFRSYKIAAGYYLFYFKVYG